MSEELDLDALEQDVQTMMPVINAGGAYVIDILVLNELIQRLRAAEKKPGGEVMKEEYEFCPFCGADMNVDADDDTELHRVDCYFNVHERYLHDRATVGEVREAWNRRAETGRAL